MHVVVLRAISGAGKTTYARQLLAQHVGTSRVVSADHLFEVDGEYRFDPARIGEAHAACLRAFVDALESGTELVIVDNTNTSVIECAPYMALAPAFGYSAEIHQLEVDPRVAAARNTHGVPADVVAKMAAKLAADQLPPWWTVRKVRAGGEAL
jgi:predicted kinase